MSRQELRFGVFNEKDGLRGATWKIWTPNNKRDIYITCRQLGGGIKFSFHESGSWHFGYSETAFHKLFKEGSAPNSRHLEIWPKPLPSIEGVIIALRIITPFSAVCVPVENTHREIVRIPSSSPEKAIECVVLITPDTEDPKGWPGKNKMGTQLVGSYAIEKSERVWVVYMEIPIPAFQSVHSTVKFFKGKSKSDILRSSNLKAIAIADGENGTKILIDSSIVK